MEAKGLTGVVTFDGQFITIRRAGMRALINGVGSGEKRLPIGNVTAVQWKAPSGLVDGFIQFTIPGSVEGKGVMSGGAWKDENSMTFKKAQQPAFEQLRSAVETTIAQRQSGAPSATVQTASAADELTKFAELREKGIISDEEFAAKKAQILGL